MTELPPPDLVDVLLSTTIVASCVAGLVMLLVLPALHLSALVMKTARWLVRALPRLLLRRRAVGEAPERPLNVAGKSPPMSRLIRQTRTLALDLRWCSAEASDRLADSNTTAPPRSGWRESLMGGTGSDPLTAIRGEVFAWLGLVDELPAGDREALPGLGVDVEAVRRALTEESAPAEVVRALAGLLWGIDERFTAASATGYRGHGAEQAAGAAAACGAGEDEERTRRQRWAGTLAEHGRGLSRMAAGYTRGAAEREDLEQDIALALWRALPLFRGESSLKTFAYRVARYCCFRHVRRRKDPGGAAVDPGSVADPAACIESAILRADQRARIEQALTGLPDNLETVLTLHLTGHSYAQIAETLGITERNVSVRLSRARARLRRELVAA